MEDGWRRSLRASQCESQDWRTGRGCLALQMPSGTYPSSFFGLPKILRAFRRLGGRTTLTLYHHRTRELYHRPIGSTIRIPSNAPARSTMPLYSDPSAITVRDPRRNPATYAVFLGSTQQSPILTDNQAA